MNPCIEWPNARNEAGYGLKWVNGKTKYVHRWVIEQIENRTLARSDIVRHLCDNPPCFRYDHLMVGNYSENIQEAWDRGQRGPCYQLAKTHCPKGHPYSEENTYAYPGGRQCRICRRQRKLDFIERRKNGS